MKNKFEWKYQETRKSIHVILEFVLDKEGNTGIVRYDTNQ